MIGQILQVFAVMMVGALAALVIMTRPGMNQGKIYDDRAQVPLHLMLGNRLRMLWQVAIAKEILIKTNHIVASQCSPHFVEHALEEIEKLLGPGVRQHNEEVHNKKEVDAKLNDQEITLK